ncbi:hypothetical protein DPEC_G00197580 [Dallia pectoralis]|uniref:Uncharacterized protein n=1 Tax=Dallia pectoralis TaxID=75939 RepID=A0ACC2G7L2_DALPE|nr:hypothetical protein DPEC_G00197580 [Dallia pectoralis]
MAPSAQSHFMQSHSGTDPPPTQKGQPAGVRGHIRGKAQVSSTGHHRSTRGGGHMAETMQRCRRGKREEERTHPRPPHPGRGGTLPRLTGQHPLLQNHKSR